MEDIILYHALGDEIDHHHIYMKESICCKNEYRKGHKYLSDSNIRCLIAVTSRMEIKTEIVYYIQLTSYFVFF